MKYNSHPIPDSIQSIWHAALNIREIRQVEGGLSNSRVWRLDTRFGPMCLKAWPNTVTSAERLDEIHRHVQLLIDSGLAFIPRVLRASGGETSFDAGGYLWEVTDWMQGEPDLSENVPRERRRAAAEAVAEVHHCWRTGRCEKQTSPGLIQRIDKLSEASQQLAVFRQNSDSISPQSRDLAHRTFSQIAIRADRLLQRLETLKYPINTHFVVRDLHSEHVLFTEDVVSGLIDFGAARIDEPTLDLVRLFSSQSPTSREQRYESLKFYCDHANRLRLGIIGGEQDGLAFDFDRMKQRFDCLDETSTLLAAFQWFQWLCVEGRAFAVRSEKLQSRWEKLLVRLECDLG